LTLPADQIAAIQKIMRQKPTIVAVEFGRPLVIPELAAGSAALLATFGVSDEALLDVLVGNVNPSGKLPFELPSSMQAVRNQLEDLPYDSLEPLFRFGHGLGYPGRR
jgi:beta-glucosidase